jgi:hypothetical protein
LADIVFIVLLALHITFIALWAGAASILSSVIFPSLGKLSPSTRAEFIISTLPRIVRFVFGVATGALVAGVLLFGYEIRVATALAPSTLGTTFIAVGAVLGLIAYVLAIGVVYPTAYKLVKTLTQARDDKTGGPPPAELPKLQSRLRMTSGAIAGLLALVLILMVIGASV